MKLQLTRLAPAALSLVVSACALTSKADLVDIRYFSPELVTPRAPLPSSPSAPPANSISLRLGRVSSGPNLRERIAFRDSTYELGYYENIRWTERPETYVRRELGRCLFETNGIHRVVGGMAPTLDVEVIAFDDLRLATGRAAQVQLKVILYEDNSVLFEGTVSAQLPVPGDHPKIEDVIATMSAALRSAAQQVAQSVQGALAAAHPVASSRATPSASSPAPAR